MLAGFEEDGAVAVVELAELLQICADVLADVEFGVGATVSHDAAEILEKMAIFRVDGARADEEDFLDVCHSLVGLSATERNVTDHIRRRDIFGIGLFLLFFVFSFL